MRTSSITGVCEASESSKPSSTALTIDGRFGRGSSSQICDFMANGMDALLHDRGAFAVILADDDQRAAGDAAGGEIGDRIGGDIGADRGFEGDRAADRIMHRGRERRRGGGFRRRVLEMDAELVEHVLGVGEHVHEMGNRRTLIAADIGDAGLQQRLGDGENSLAAELLAVAELEILHFACKRPFRHESLRADVIDQARPADLIFMKPSHSSCNGRAVVGTGTRRVHLRRQLFPDCPRTKLMIPEKSEVP